MNLSLLVVVILSTYIQISSQLENNSRGSLIPGNAVEHSKTAAKTFKNSKLSMDKKATMESRERCWGCMFIWEKSHMMLDASSGYDDVRLAFEQACSDVPDVFMDSCDLMIVHEDDMIKDYLNNKSFNEICTFAALCSPPSSQK